MTARSDRQFTIARTYCLAMLSLAESQGEVDVLYGELVDLSRLMESNPAFRAFLSSPTVDLDARRRAFERLFRGRCSDLFVDSLQVINRKGRLSLLPAVIEAYRQARDAAQGRVEVEVRSARPLSDAMREDIRRIVWHVADKEADLVELIDESVLGGLMVRIGDQKLDATVATRLRRAAERFHQRASSEIHRGTLPFEAA